MIKEVSISCTRTCSLTVEDFLLLTYSAGVHKYADCPEVSLSQSVYLLMMMKCLTVPESELTSAWLQQSIWITYSLIHAHSNRAVWSLWHVSACMFSVCPHVYLCSTRLHCHVMLPRLRDHQVYFSQRVVWNWALIKSHFSGKWSQTSHKVAQLSWHFHSRLTATNPSALLQNKLRTLFQPKKGNADTVSCLWSQLDVGAHVMEKATYECK